MYMLNIFDQFSKTMDSFKNWIFEHHNNPFLWLGLFLLGLAIFGMTYRALQKEK